MTTFSQEAQKDRQIILAARGLVCHQRKANKAIGPRRWWLSYHRTDLKAGQAANVAARASPVLVTIIYSATSEDEEMQLRHKALAPAILSGIMILPCIVAFRVIRGSRFANYANRMCRGKQ